MMLQFYYKNANPEQPNEGTWRGQGLGGSQTLPCCLPAESEYVTPPAHQYVHQPGRSPELWCLEFLTGFYDFIIGYVIEVDLQPPFSPWRSGWLKVPTL